MEVINDRVSVLTNNEVLRLLQATMKEQENTEYKTKCLKNISVATIQYLTKTPAVNQNTENISDLIRKLKPYKLSGAETLQIINLRPKTTTDVQLIVEESEERLKTEEQLNSLLNIITTTLP